MEDNGILHGRREKNTFLVKRGEDNLARQPAGIQSRMAWFSFSVKAMSSCMVGNSSLAKQNSSDQGLRRMASLSSSG